MVLCCNPDCCVLIRTGEMYCSGYCEKEARRMHGRVFHLSEIEHIAKGAVTVEILLKRLKSRTEEAEALRTRTDNRKFYICVLTGLVWEFDEDCLVW